MNAKTNYDNMYLKVYPRRAGNFGMCSISGIEYENDNHIQDIEADIKRHVNDVENIEICFDGKEFYCNECGDEFDKLEDAEKCCKKQL